MPPASPLGKEPPALSPSADAPSSTGGRCRILVIEDNRDSADSLRLFLETVGHEVRVAYNGPDGVRLGDEWRPEVVLCDIGLPGLDGYGVADELRRRSVAATARLIAVTAYGSDEDRERTRQHGFIAHLTKPADPIVLLRLLAAG